LKEIADDTVIRQKAE